jgi:hypothetical protein
MTFKVGEEVDGGPYGRGEVIEINDAAYSIEVKFKDGTIETFTEEGKLCASDSHPWLKHIADPEEQPRKRLGS